MADPNARNKFGFTAEQELVRAQFNQGPQLRATFISLIPLSTVFLLLRFAARKIARTPIWWDDYFAVIAWAAAVTLCSILISAVDTGGLGRHAEIAGLPAVMYGNKILFASEITYQFSMTCIKLSILLFYYRIFKLSRYFNNALCIMTTVTLCWYATSTFVIIFQCKPINYLWDQSTPGGQCIPQERLWIGSSVTSLLTDVAVLCLPMPMIWRLRATRNQKIALTGIFLLGAFVCITSIIRLTKISDLNIQDPSYSFIPPAIWTSVECSVAVISASLPTLKPLFRTIFDLTDVLPFDTGMHQRKVSDPPSTSDGGLSAATRFGGNQFHSANNSSGGGGRNHRGAILNTPSMGTIAASPNMTHNPDTRIRNWRAQANAKRIDELGEYRTDNAGHHYVNETGVWEQDEKRFIPGTRGHVDGNGNGRKFSVAGMREKFSGKKSSPTLKQSAETLGAAPTTRGTLGGSTMGKPSRDTLKRQHEQYSHSGSGRGAAAPNGGASTPIFGGGHAGLGIEVRADSPHIWNRAGERGSWRPVHLGGFEFERTAQGAKKPPALPHESSTESGSGLSSDGSVSPSGHNRRGGGGVDAGVGGQRGRGGLGKTPGVPTIGGLKRAGMGIQREESGDSEITYADPLDTMTGGGDTTSSSAGAAGGRRGMGIAM